MRQEHRMDLKGQADVNRYLVKNRKTDKLMFRYCGIYFDQSDKMTT